MAIIIIVLIITEEVGAAEGLEAAQGGGGLLGEEQLALDVGLLADEHFNVLLGILVIVLAVFTFVVWVEVEFIAVGLLEVFA